MNAGRRARSVARLAAVQALYQMETAGAGVEAVVREFRDHRFDADLEGKPLARADEPFFADLARGVVAAQREIDAAISERLAADWRLERLDATVRAILRCAVFELRFRQDVPREVAINEYLEIAKSFFGGAEAGFINGVLDSIARDDRLAG
ncbi:MAG TPA: transcription antitermination factor NusB [Caulobacteraceae bacterium]|nr:transcription antitermination factor NusB [Caulobacteraceae bacterium]